MQAAQDRIDGNIARTRGYIADKQKRIGVLDDAIAAATSAGGVTASILLGIISVGIVAAARAMSLSAMRAERAALIKGTADLKRDLTRMQNQRVDENYKDTIAQIQEEENHFAEFCASLEKPDEYK
jgi:hypothetical protein